MNTKLEKGNTGDYELMIRRWAWAVIVICLFAVFSNTLRNGLTWDDHVVLGEGTMSGSLANVKYLFTSDYFSSSGETTYRPAVTLSYMLDHAVWKANPSGYHLTNILLHIAVCLLLFYWLRDRLKSSLKALCVSLVFGLHPVVTEPVNSIGFREDLLAAFFIMLTIVYFRSRWSGMKARLAVILPGLVLALAAYSSKESALVLPALLFLDYYWANNAAGINWKVNIKGFIKIILPMALIAVVFVVLQIILSRYYVKSVQELNMAGAGPLVFFKALAYYISRIFWPVDLYTIPPVSSFPLFDGYFAAGLALFAASLAAACFFGRKHYLWALIAAWFYISLLPVSNVVPILNFVAERYLYLPMIGAAILITEVIFRVLSVITKIPDRIAGSITVAVLVSVLLIYGFLSHTRNDVWKSDITLWEFSLGQTPGSNLAMYRLASSFHRIGLDDRALEMYERLYRSDPNDVKSANNLAGIYRDQGRYKQAIEIYEALIERYPDTAVLHRNLGNCYLDDGQYDLAEMAYTTALGRDKYDCGTWNNLALVEIKRKKFDRAGKYLYDAYDCGHQSIGTLLNLVRFHIMTDDYVMAEKMLAEYRSDKGDKAYLVMKGLLAKRTNSRTMAAETIEEWGVDVAGLKKAVDEMDMKLAELLE